jgi:hypothetical protein
VQESFYRNQAMNFMTPAKRKRDLDEDALELITAVPYSPLFKDDEDLVLGDLSKVSGLLSRFDQSFLTMNGTMMSFLEDYKNQSDKATVAISSLWFRLLDEAIGLSTRCNPHTIPSAISMGFYW